MLSEGAAKDLSGDTQMWLMGLIGFQRACRIRRGLTLTRLLQRHPGKGKKHERSRDKINVSDDIGAGSEGRRQG